MKSWVARILNLILFLSFCLLVGTGLMMAYRLPPGSQGGRGLTVMGLRRHDWGEIHLWSGWIFVGLIILHLFLHWNWLLKIAGQNSFVKLLLGFGVGIAIILALLLAK